MIIAVITVVAYTIGLLATLFAWVFILYVMSTAYVNVVVWASSNKEQREYLTRRNR